MVSKPSERLMSAPSFSPLLKLIAVSVGVNGVGVSSPGALSDEQATRLMSPMSPMSLIGLISPIGPIGLIGLISPIGLSLIIGHLLSGSAEPPVG